MILKAGSIIICFLVKPKVRHITLRVYSTLFNVFSRYRRETPRNASAFPRQNSNR